MGGVSWSDHQKLQHKNEEQKSHIDNLEKENNQLKKRFEERQKEIKIQQELREKEERDFQQKKKLAFEDMNNSLKKKIEEELKKIEEEFQSLSKNWCIEEINEIDLEKEIKDCYEKLFQSEKTEENIKENVRKLVKDLIKENEINHLNLEIIGKTGVGKSTLINAIFGEEVAKVKMGEPCTMETKCYEI